MTILYVQVRNPEEPETSGGHILFSEYIEIPSDLSPVEVISAALAQAFLSHGIKKGKNPQELSLNRDDIISMYVNELMSTQQIADTVRGVSDGTIGRFLRANGVELRKPGKRTYTPSPEMKDQVVRLYSQEMKTMGEVARHTGLTIHQVRKILTEEKVYMRVGRPARINLPERSRDALR